jgi:dolichol-phosphate mannosyltransferase
VLRYFLGEGHELSVLVRSADPGWRLSEIASDIRILVAPLEDASGVEAAVAQVRPDWIFHFAAYGAYSNQRDEGRIFASNLLGTMHLADAAARNGVDLLINAGSSSEYGFCDHAPSETERVYPNSAYAFAKAAAALYGTFLAGQRRLRMITARLYSVFGPFEEPGRLIPQIILKGLRGTLPPLVDPSVARDFIYVDDVSRAFAAIAAAPDAADIYNVGSGMQTTIGELVDIAKATFAISEAPAWGSMGNRSWDTGTWVANVERIQLDTGWTPQVSDGIARMATWLQADHSMLERYMAQQTLPP